MQSPWTLHSDPLESPPHCAPNLTAPPLPLSRVRATSQPAATSRALLPACFSPRGQSHLRRRKPRPASPFSAETPGRLLTAGAATPSSHGARRARAASVPAVRSAPVTGPSLCPPRVRGFCPGCAFCSESPARPRRPPDACSSSASRSEPVRVAAYRAADEATISPLHRELLACPFCSPTQSPIRSVVAHEGGLPSRRWRSKVSVVSELLRRQIKINLPRYPLTKSAEFHTISSVNKRHKHISYLLRRMPGGVPTPSPVHTLLGQVLRKPHSLGSAILSSPPKRTCAVLGGEPASSDVSDSMGSTCHVENPHSPEGSEKHPI